MKDLYEFLREKMKNQIEENLIDIRFSNNLNLIEYEISDNLYEIISRNEFLIIYDSDENEIFRMNYLIFEENEILLYEIISHFISNQIDYLKEN